MSCYYPFPLDIYTHLHRYLKSALGNKFKWSPLDSWHYNIITCPQSSPPAESVQDIKPRVDAINMKIKRPLKHE